jgi:hypothetical protein
MRWLALLFLISCGKVSGLTYDNNDLELLTAYRAKEVCSCIFVMKQSEEFCAAWTIASPNLATFHIDRAQKRVEAVAAIMWNAAAHWDSDRAGCILE